MEREINFNNIVTTCKRGSCVRNGEIDNEIPIFTQDRGYVEELL